MQTQQLQLDALANCDRIFTETVSGAKRMADSSGRSNDPLNPQLVLRWKLLGCRQGDVAGRFV